MKSYKGLFILFILAYSTIQAQQDPNTIFYRYNMNIYNPAFAGSSESSDITLGIRSQWAGIEGAPEGQSAIFSTPLNKKAGLGVSILNDKTFIENQTSVAVDFSYHIQLSDSYKLFFGLKASANSYSANTSGLVTYGIGQDPTLTDYESRFMPNIGAGLLLLHQDYFLSFSIPRLLTPERLQEKDGTAYLGESRMHLYLSGGYDLRLGASSKLQNSVMFRYVNATPLSVEITSILDFGYKFNLGASYRYDESVSGLFLFKVSDNFNLGYAYEVTTGNVFNQNKASSHELFMRLSI
ncbi:PorP/SprF family type IX secretion system membrane protein [Arenibacter palladensis]|uniref:PorP/SprF family type IX secretion system membrane protein n=1 Tax=Arenibacter palladensis TaxID=237373 RepID=UPI0026E1458B|nr:type IX secretion system membrane protein PorP/SprF [Arenibacter palladensis]MDO6602038.1 type IX secretion system membrane protein PorP/SprF [Arenibacter palladensis]